MNDLNAISDHEYALIRDLLWQQVGISLGAAKQTLVCSRLGRRVRALRLDSYASYVRHLLSGHDPGELQQAIDLLTTNETYFFREPQHFAMLAELARAAPRSQPFRVWSAACSSGEEVYSIAMTLAEQRRLLCGPPWAVRGSDISSRVLELARGAHYRCERTEGISPALLKRYCLRGTGPYQGTILMDPQLRAQVEFAQINLIEPLPALVPFQVIFLRNVLIYFELPEKRRIVRQLLDALAPGGVLFVGLAESLNGVVDGLVTVGPGAYRRDRRERLP